jgi:glucarate dehydratase
MRETGEGEVRTIEQVLVNARELKQKYGFTSHKVKAGVFHPDYELEVYRAVARVPRRPHSLRLQCGVVHGAGDPLRPGDRGFAERLSGRPGVRLHGMRRVRQMVRVPLATNTVVVNFEQLAANILDTAVDVILLDTTFWGGIRACVKAAGVCETFQIGVAVHSSGELGIQLATMLHLGAVIPNLSFAADAHYHHLADDIIEGGLMRYEGGSIAVPDGPGIGREVKPRKVRRVRGVVPEVRELRVRSGSVAAGLGADHSE